MAIYLSNDSQNFVPQFWIFSEILILNGDIGGDIIRTSQAEMELSRGYVPMDQLEGYIFV